MPILAVIDVDDEGSLKIQNFKDTMEGLNLSLRKSREEGDKNEQSTKRQADALSRLTDDVRKNQMETLRFVQGLRLVASEMRAGNTATAERIAALRQLSAMAAQNNTLSAQHRVSLSTLAATMQAGTAITKQQAAALQSAAQAATNAVTSNAGLSQSMGNLQAQAAALAGALGAAGLGYALKSYLEESFQIAARNQVLATSMTVVAKNSFRSASDMELQVQQIRSLGITTKEARGAVLDFAQANLKLADASKLARVAQDLAVVGGMNSSEAFNRLTTAIQVQQPVMLRSFGIVSGLDEIYGKYARTIGKNVTEMDAYDKRMAFMNRILAEGEKVAGAYELSMNDVGKMIGSNARLVEELQAKIGQALLPVIKDLVVGYQSLLKYLEGLSPTMMRWVTAVLAGAAAMTSLAAAIGAFKALAILATLSGITPAVLAVAAAVGVLTAAWVVWRGESEYDVKAANDAVVQLRMQRDSVNAQAKAVEEASKAYRDARAAGEDTTKAHERMTVAVNKLTLSVPGAIQNFDALNGTLSIERSKIDEVIAGYESLIKYRSDATQKALDEKEKEAAAMAAASNEVAAALNSGKKITDLKQLSNETMRMVQLNTSNWSRFTGSLGKDLTGSLNAFMSAAQSRLKELGANIAELKSGLSSQSLGDDGGRMDGLRASIETLAGGEGKLRAYLTKLKTTWDEYKGANEDQLREIEQNVRGLVDKDAQNLQKWQAAYQKTFKSITQTAETTGADFSAVRAALKGAGEGTEEYAAILLRSKGVLDSLSKSVPALQKEFADLQGPVEELKAIGLEETFQKWTDKAEEAAQAIDQVLAEDRARDQLAVAEKIGQADRKLADDRITMARELEMLEREVTDRRVEGTLTGVQKELQANNRYYADKRYAVEEDIRQRQAAMAEEFHQLELTRAARDRELAQTVARAKQRFRVEVETATATEKAKRTIAAGRSAEQIAAEIKDIEARYQMFLDAQAAQQRAANERLYVDEKASLDRRAGALEEYASKARGVLSTLATDNATTNANILRDYDYTYQKAGEFAAQFVSQVVDGLASIITGAKSFKDVFIGIWQSIKSEVSKIMGEIVSNTVRGLMGIGTGGVGGRAGMATALGGMFGGGGTASAAGIGTVAGGAPWAVTPYAGSSAGAGAGASIAGIAAPAAGGGLVGYGIGSLFFDSRWKGALAGGIGGAATGAGIGSFVGPYGAGVGAIIGGVAGALGGAFGAGAKLRKTREARDQWFDQNGGIDNLIKIAEKYNVSLDKVMNARRVGDLTKAVSDWQKAIEAADKAAELKKAKQGLGQTVEDLERLEERAKRVGFNMRDLYDAETIEDFNEQQERLNELLAFQERRIQNLLKAAEGLNQRVAAAKASLDKAVAEAFKDMPDNRRKHLDEYYAREKERGFTGSQTKYLLENGVREGILTEEELEKLRAAVEKTKGEFGRLGAYATAIFANILKETGDISAAMEAIAPALDTMVQMRDELGIEVSGSLQKLLDLRKAVTDNADVVQAMTGIKNMIEGLGEAGALSSDLMNTFGADLNAQWETLKERGVDANTALLMMQPSLQALYEAQKRYGLQVDESTQKLIDMGVENGMVGDDFMSVNERMFDVLVLIAETLGADIPEAYRRAKEAAEKATEKTEAGVDDTNTSIEDQQEYLRNTGVAWHNWAEGALYEMARVNAAAANVEAPGPGGGTGAGSTPGSGGGSADGQSSGASVAVAGGVVHANVILDGRVAAKAVVPFLPSVARQSGVRSS